ncbi:MAG: excinuclease ABC subunit UvrC [Fimbriimonadaceae bacterium]|nr:excinuclease ABC subunit UvrC [Fimbriimonadaceae bacterium]QYK56110.1 MAG: excinuclease ABC subunit UvrC [Fimbriimonadaceae bacterium]
MPRAQSLPETVSEKLRGLPTRPGCYIYRDSKGEVLYVGKALNLRNRVRSYFQPSAKLGNRIARMVAKVCDLEWIVVDSEIEALVLECNLIKEHRPPYNVLMRDDKSYPYIIVTKEPYPRVLFTRNPKRWAAKAYGPYTSAWAVRDTLQLLHKTFPLIPCGKSWSGKADQRPCLYYHLKQCLGPCAGLSDKDEYDKIIAQVHKFLQGRESGLLADLRSQMAAYVEDLEFEQAAAVRDRIEAVEKVLTKQKVMSEDESDRDVIAVVKDDRGAAVQMLYIRGGRLIGQRQFVLDGSKDVAPGEAVQEFVKQYYSDAAEIPREVLLPVEIEERRIVESFLRQRRGGAVSVEVPQGGEGMRLIDMAASNAEQALKVMALELEQKELAAERAAEELAEALDLPTPPVRIEGYDISNVQGTAPVGSMVVAEAGEAAKGEYRRFKVKWSPESPDDFAMMHEVLYRRLKAYRDGDEKFSRLPDLIMIDGGKGQLGAALKARNELGLTVPMVGLAKKQEILYLPLEQPCSVLVDGEAESAKGYREVVLPMGSPGLELLKRLRDEAHRFALGYHRKVRDKRFQGSVLDEVPGIGPKKRRLLLRTFGSIEAIRRATVEEIAAVPTLTLRQAETVREFLRRD